MKKVDENFIVGILGGMGPYAGVEFQKKILSMTPVKNECDHIKMICFTNPKIKDRTECIINGEDFSSSIINSFKTMEKMKINIGVMACNTAHVEFDKISKELKLPLINIVQETVNFVKNKNVNKVGVLATDGTVVSGVYKKEFSKDNIETIYPESENQRIIMEIIYGSYGIKKGKVDNKLNYLILIKVIKELLEKGAENVILGCTELSLYKFNNKKIIDPLEVVSEIVIKKAMK